MSATLVSDGGSTEWRRKAGTPEQKPQQGLPRRLDAAAHQLSSSPCESRSPSTCGIDRVAQLGECRVRTRISRIGDSRIEDQVVAEGDEVVQPQNGGHFPEGAHRIRTR